VNGATAVTPHLARFAAGTHVGAVAGESVGHHLADDGRLGRQQVLARFDNSDAGTEPRVDLGELAADRPAAEHDE
jgi:hypothetical protein